MLSQQQQRRLVAITIRGFALFYSSAIQKPDFYPVTKFRYLYGVHLIELRTLFYHWKMCCDLFDNKKIQNIKLNHKDSVFMIFKLVFSHKTEGFVQSQRAWTLMIDLSRKCYVIPMTWRHKSYNVTSRNDNVLCKTPTVTCIVTPLKEAITSYIMYTQA